MRMDINISVNVPQITADQRLEFVEGVMAVFRAGFPDAKPLESPGHPSPVTVVLHAEDNDDHTEL